MNKPLTTFAIDSPHMLVIASWPHGHTNSPVHEFHLGTTEGH